MTGFVPPGPGQPEPPSRAEPGSPPGQQPPYGGYPTYGGYPAYPAPPSYDHNSAEREARQSRTMAGWALGLSFVFCIPLAPLVAGALAITALVQAGRASREGRPRNHGTGMAIAALPIAAVNLVATIALVASGVLDDIDLEDEPERGESGEVVEAGDLMPSKLRVGDCFNEPQLEALGATEQFETGLVDVVPCRGPHDAEVYHSFQMKGSEYPGQAAIDREALTCAREFKQFVGLPYARSRLEFVYYFPTQQSWDFLDDRGIVCSVYDPIRGRVSASLEGSRR